MKRGILLTIIALIIAGASGLAGYYYCVHTKPCSTSTTNGQPAPTQLPPATPDTQSPTTRQNGITDTTSHAVKVYFSKHPESDDDPGRVFPVDRTSPDSSVGKYAVAQLLRGPTASEQQSGYFATARLRNDTSTCNGDFTLTVQAGVATLQFCKPFDHIGSISDGQAESELKATLLQFSTVQKVVILNRYGDCEFNLSGLNLCK